MALLTERAAWWPRRKAVLIADPHFGKSAAFRRAGRAVPETAMQRDLERLSRVIRSNRARSLLILGDFLHDRTGRTAATLDALRHWRLAHADLEIVLVRGNHDQHAGDPPADLRIAVVDAPHRLEPFTLAHELDGAADQTGAGFTLAGHVHPVAVMRDGMGGRLRLPCFHQTRSGLVFPSFGSFTGGHGVTVRRGDRVYLVGPDAVIEAPVESATPTVAPTN